MWLWLSGGVQRGHAWLTESYLNYAADAGFKVQDILVEGRVHTDGAQLLALIGMQRGDPIMDFKPDEVRAEIEKISWVRTARVERRLPGTIYVGLQERVPLALWQNGKKLHVIDADGKILTSEGLGPFRNLPVVVGEGAPANAAAMLKLLNAEPSIQGRVEAARWVGQRRWDLHLENGLVVRLPESDLALALRRLAVTQDKEKILDRDLVAIDVRENDRIIVQTRPGTVQDYKDQLKAGKQI